MQSDQANGTAACVPIVDLLNGLGLASQTTDPLTPAVTLDEMPIADQIDAAEPCAPLIKWPGGKRSELPSIAPRVPRHDRYFEPFFGGGGVFFALIDCESWGNDLHPDLIMLYELVAAQDAGFLGALHDFLGRWERSTLDQREGLYYECRSRYNGHRGSDACRAADFFVLRELAYGGMFRFNSRGEFNVPFGRAYGRSGILTKKIRRLSAPSVQAKLSRLHLSALDFADFLGKHKFGPTDFMFVDPPYDTAFSNYVGNGFDAEDQRRLAEALLNFKGMFMLVCKITPLIEDLYFNAGLNVLEYEANYRFNIKGRFSRDARHAMVMNY